MAVGRDQDSIYPENQLPVYSAPNEVADRRHKEDFRIERARQ